MGYKGSVKSKVLGLVYKKKTELHGTWKLVKNGQWIKKLESMKDNLTRNAQNDISRYLMAISKIHIQFIF